MANNFIKGIDLVLDPTGNTALADHIFYSVDGSDANPGTNPNLPKATASLTAGLAGDTYVLGADQVYDSIIQINSGTIQGDGQAIIDGLGINALGSGSGNVSFNDVIITGYANLNWPSSPAGVINYGANNTLFINNTHTGTIGTVNFGGIQNCFFNHNVRLQIRALDGFIKRCVFYNSAVDISFQSALAGECDSHVFMNCIVVCLLADAERIDHCYFEGCSFIIEGIPYADFATMIAAVPTAFPNYVTGDPQIIGDYDQYEFRTVGAGSALLGAGKNGVNVGGVNIGAVFNSLSSISSFNNAQYNANILEQISQLTYGEVFFQIIELPRVVTDPYIYVNGISDFQNNVLIVDQAPYPTLPRKRTVRISTADIDGVLRPERVYRSGFRISEDANGVYSGGDDYHEYAPVRSRVKYVVVTIELNS